ncbi:MAG: AAA family ATPase [Bacillota bacterium]
MTINIFAFGSNIFIQNCKSVLNEVETEGEPGTNDIVLLEHPATEGVDIFQESKKYLPARVYVISTPSLEVWRAATESGVTVLSSIEAVADKIYPNVWSRRSKRTVLRTLLKPQNDATPESENLEEPIGCISAEYTQSEEPDEDYVEEQPVGILLNEPLKSNFPVETEGLYNTTAFKRRGRLICVYSLIGGVGKTTISLNLAELLRYCGKDSCLVDFDLNSAGSTVYFWPGSMPAPTSILLWEDFPVDRRESRETVEKHLAKTPSGFYMLPAPKDVMLSSLVSDVLPGTVLDVLLDHFDYVIVDMGTDMRQFGAKKALSMADTVLMVARPDDVSVSGAVRFLNHVGQGKLIRPERLKFVVNRNRPRPPKKPSEVAKSAGLKLDFVLPEDEKSMVEAVRRHILPINLKESPLGAAITALAEGINPDLMVRRSVPTGLFSKMSSTISRIFRKKGVDQPEDIVNAQ